jgi:DNA-directed RNA polymerase subunit L
MTKHKIKPIFNPTFKIADLQPGKCIKIEGFKIESGTGLAKFNACCGAVCIPLDIESESSDKLCDNSKVSGYKLPSQLSNPLKHMIKFYIPAMYGDAPEVKSVITRAIVCLRNRLRNINLEDKDLYKVFEKNGRHEAVLQLPKETMTIGNLIVQYLYELSGSNITSTATDGHHAEEVTINVVASEPPKAMIKKAIVRIIMELDAIGEDVKKIQVQKYPMQDYIKEFNKGRKI